MQGRWNLVKMYVGRAGTDAINKRDELVMIEIKSSARVAGP